MPRAGTVVVALSRGVARDPAQALAWYRKAAAAGGNSMGQTGALESEIARRSARDRRNTPETLRCLRFVDVLVPTTVDGKVRREDGSIVQERNRGPDVLVERLRNQCDRPVETVFQCRTGRVAMPLAPGRDYVPSDLPSGTIEGLTVPPSFLEGIVTFRSEPCE